MSAQPFDVVQRPWFVIVAYNYIPVSYIIGFLLCRNAPNFIFEIVLCFFNSLINVSLTKNKKHIVPYIHGYS